MVTTRITPRQNDVWRFYLDDEPSGPKCAAALGITNSRVYQLCDELWRKGLMLKNGHYWRAIPGNVEIATPPRKRMEPWTVKGVRPYRERRI